MVDFLIDIIGFAVADMLALLLDGVIGPPSWRARCEARRKAGEARRKARRKAGEARRKARRKASEARRKARQEKKNKKYL